MNLKGGSFLTILHLTLNLLTTTIVAPPSNSSKWQMGFNLAFKGLIKTKERIPLFGRGIASVGSAYSGGERVVEQRCTCRFQCTPWRGRENIDPLFLRSL